MLVKDRLAESNFKIKWKKDRERATKAKEAKAKTDKLLKERKFKQWKAKNAAKAIAQERKLKRCDVDKDEKFQKAYEAKSQERDAKKSLAVEQARANRAARHLKLSTKETEQKHFQAAFKSSNEKVAKARKLERQRVKERMHTLHKEELRDKRCKAKELRKKTAEKGFKKARAARG